MQFYKGNRSGELILLIVLSVLAGAFSRSCQKECEIFTEFTITKNNPSKHEINDGRIEVRFSDQLCKPEVIWRKDDYSLYSEVSSEYTVVGLSSGMYQLEVLWSPDSRSIGMAYLASYDTISPGAYFPLYPGSYWIYDNSDTITCLEEYKLIGLGHRYTGISQTHGDHNDPAFPVDSIYVPTIYVSSKDMEYIFYNYSITSSGYLTRFLPILNEEEGFYIKQWPDDRYDYDYNSLRILKVDTSLQIGNKLYEQVIIAEHFNMPNLVGDFDFYYVIKKLYFAKDIGLIKSDVYFQRGSLYNLYIYDSLTINLVDYYIQNN